MKLLGHMLLSLLLWIGVGAAVADNGPPLREAQSDNGRFRLRIQPGQPGSSALRGCKAALYERSAGHQRGRPRWERFLVNDVAPAVTCIRDDGRFVVTLDEHRIGGARHALVIYGERGELLRHFLLPDLLEWDDWKHVKVRRQSLDWLAGAKFEFTEKPPRFVITLRRDRRIRIDLHTLQVIREEDGTGAVEAIPVEFLALLFGQAATQPEQVEAPIGASTQPADGIVVPRPDPANPFDYLAWANQAVLTEGPNAAPEYQAAMDNLAPWEGDPEFLKAAIRGNAQALASPEVQAWLDANRQAMDHFRRATDLEFAGWEMNSADGSLLGAVLPHMSSLRQLAYATVLDGRLLEAEGNLSAAAGNYMDTFAAGTHTGSGPTLIEKLVGIAIQKLAADALMDLQAGDTGGEIDYPDLAQRLESSCRPTRPLGESMQFERAVFMDCLQRLYDYDPDSGSYLLNVAQADDYLSQGRNADPAARQEQLWHLMDTGYEQTRKAGDAFYDGITEAMLLPFPQAQQRMREIEQSVADNPDANPLVRLLAPNLRRAHVLHVRAESYGRATRVIANLRAFRQQHGVYPESLQAFGGADFAIDPLTARPFRYRLDGDDFTLYSLGSNGTDEGGVHDRRAKTNDILFWPRPGEE